MDVDLSRPTHRYQRWLPHLCWATAALDLTLPYAIARQPSQPGSARPGVPTGATDSPADDGDHDASAQQ